MAVGSTGRSGPQRFEIGGGYSVHSEIRPDRFIDFFKAAASVLGKQEGVDYIIERYLQPIGPHSPLIRVVPDAVLRTDDGGIGGIGTHDQMGRRLTFSAPAVAEIPEELGLRLVLHEFAHVHTYAELHFGVIEVHEKHQLEDVANKPSKLRELLEQSADSRLLAWGHNPDPLRDWTTEYLMRLGLV
jgi:hypothetical protein